MSDLSAEELAAIANDLPNLTDRQQRFVMARLAGKSGADSVRACCDTSNWTQAAIWAEAAKLNANPSISLWMAEARKAALGTAIITKEQHLADLERLRELATDSKAYAAAVQAELARGKVAGHYVEQVADVTQHSPERTLNKIAEHAPDLAAQLAIMHGIPWKVADDSPSPSTH